MCHCRLITEHTGLSFEPGDADCTGVLVEPHTNAWGLESMLKSCCAGESELGKALATVPGLANLKGGKKGLPIQPGCHSKLQRRAEKAGGSLYLSYHKDTKQWKRIGEARLGGFSA